MIITSLALICGFTILVFCADKFIASASSIARTMNISPLLIGLTIVAFGTSLPELLISMAAALSGNTDLILGNAVGSNIANIGLVLGVSAIFLPIAIQSTVLKREIPILWLVMAITYYLAWNDMLLSRTDGVILLGMLAIYIIWLVVVGIRASKSDPLTQEYNQDVPFDDMSMPLALSWLVVGMIMMPLSAKLTVFGAVGMAKFFGISDLVIGLTVVAIGTSLPELVAVIVSLYKKEPDIAVGNIIGSNIFNLAGVIGLPAVIAATKVPPMVLSRDYLVMTFFTLMLLLTTYSYRKPGRISRLEGGILLIFYLIYMMILYYAEN